MSLTGAVRRTPELARILDLPRRRLEDAATQALADELTDALRVGTCPGRPGPGGLCTVCEAPMRLRPAQALALVELTEQRGAFCPLGVGEGKTLISLLAAYLLDAERPLLLLPAGLVEKTKRDRKKLAGHWPVPTNVQLVSYEWLGRVSAETFLEDQRPDLVVCDEAHKLKNRHAAVTRRVGRYIHAHLETLFVGLSGTVMDRSLNEFAHLLRWALREGAPVPRTVEETEEWAMALDERVDEFARLRPGALVDLVRGSGVDRNTRLAEALPVVRRGFRDRLVQTPGVVSTVGRGEDIGASIQVRAIRYDVQPVTDEWFELLRDEMQTPDEWQLEQGVDVWRHSRELSLGFHSTWSPRPPDDWRRARRAWFSFVRETLSRSRTLDSPLHVELAVDAGRVHDGGLLAAWRRVKDTFTPNVVPVWHDDSALHVCTEWMHKPGIVWTEHVPFARRLAALTGAAYYGQQGLTDDGRFIDDADGKRAIIASIDANREGRNLQARWHRCLYTAPPEGPGIWQQSIGRFHRPGQHADEVIVDVLLGCKEHANAWRRATAAAQAVLDTTGAPQKLLLASVEWPSDEEIAGYAGRRWR